MKNKMKTAKETITTAWDGAVWLGRIIGELLLGASAVGVLAMAALYVQNTQPTVPKLLAYCMIFAVVLMALVALSVLGSYLRRKGAQNRFEH